MKLTKLAVATAAALGVALSGAVFAGGDKAKTSAGNAAPTPTANSSQGTGSQGGVANTSDARLSGITGQTVRDANGNTLGTVQSYTTANGQVTGTIIGASGTTQEVQLGSVDSLSGYSGSNGLTVQQSGSVSSGSTSSGMSGSSSSSMGTNGSATPGASGTTSTDTSGQASTASPRQSSMTGTESAAGTNGSSATGKAVKPKTTSGSTSSMPK